MHHSNGLPGRCVTAILMIWMAVQPAWSETRADEAASWQEPAAGTGQFPWPQQFESNGRSFTVYPPELDRWEADRLDGRAAVAVRDAGSERTVFGMVWLSARTETSGVMVAVRNITLRRASFPTSADLAPEYLASLRERMGIVSWSMPIDRLRANVAIDQNSQQTRRQAVRNMVPRIVYAESPTTLVLIDGEPVLRELSGTDLMRVINTRALMLMDKSSGRYYLCAADHWLEASAVEGPWTEAQVRPSTLDEAKRTLVAAGQSDPLESAGTENGPSPAIVVSIVPAELVQTDGLPQYAPVEGTQLLYVTNSPNRLFLDLQGQQYYVLLAGRWYRTPALQRGPWEYTAGASLPTDLAKIPETHSTQSVRSAVPGTPQAQEAAIANNVPQVATVKRSTARLEIGYDGPPQFTPIVGTSLEAAINAPIPVIRVDPEAYYALDNGVWFVARSPEGPWTAAGTVPPVIYTIPRSSPLHYVTYVRVYDATPEVVYEGYTPGYVGSYLTPESTVVYGTGWYYRPWVGSVWYGSPVTWGFGFTVFNTWWNPWPWQPWWGAGWGPYPYGHVRPWWGPWRSMGMVRPVGYPVAPAGGRVVVNNIYGGTVNVTNIYRRWGDRVAVPVVTPALTPGAMTRAATPTSRPIGRGADGIAAPWAGSPTSPAREFAGHSSPPRFASLPDEARMRPGNGSTTTSPGTPGGTPQSSIDGSFRGSRGEQSWRSYRSTDGRYQGGTPSLPTGPSVSAPSEHFRSAPNPSSFGPGPIHPPQVGAGGLAAPRGQAGFGAYGQGHDARAAPGRGGGHR